MAAKKIVETQDCCWDGDCGFCRCLNVKESSGKRVLGHKRFGGGEQGFNLSGG